MHLTRECFFDLNENISVELLLDFQSLLVKILNVYLVYFEIDLDLEELFESFLEEYLNLLKDHQVVDLYDASDL